MKFRQPLLQFAPTLALSVMFAISGCSGHAGGAVTPPPEVAVVTVHHDAVPVMTELPGRTSAYLIAEVRARVDGIVEQRSFDEGAAVAANERLYQIDPLPYRVALDSARAQLARAQANVESTTAQAQRDEVLVAANAVSKQASLNSLAAERQAAADVAAGRAAVQAAAINLGYTDVASPISGRVGPALVTRGAYVQASAATLMATIQQIDPIYVDLTQSSVEGLQLRNQVASGRLNLNGPDRAQVRLVLEDGTEYAHAGSLQFTDITVDRGTGSVAIRALFPNPDAVLLPGMFVRARIDQGTDARAMLVPQVGVTHDRNGRATVLVVRTDETVALQTVVATRTYGDDWVVESGLNDGDRVIVAGVQKVQPGMLVRATVAHPDVPGQRLAQNTTAK